MSEPVLTMRVPIRALADLEEAQMRLWLVTNKAVGELEAGAKAQPLLALLKDELGMALAAFQRWHLAKWGPPAGPGGQAA